jgi:cytochrome P450/NADPH-cytochrome P450 reductase
VSVEHLLDSTSRVNKRSVLSIHHLLSRLSQSFQIILSSGDGSTSLPVDKSINVHSLLSGYVELSQPARSSDIRVLLKYTPDVTKSGLDRLLAAHAELVMAVRLSILDILERHRDITIPFPVYLQLLPSMRVRQYSISSSPLWNPRHATLTLTVMQAPALANDEQQFFGVGSSYLASLQTGDRVAVSVRPSNALFHLPADPAVPVIMFAAGSGIAPMRGFIQERAEQKKAGREIGKMLLYYGCREPGMDYLYSKSDLKEWIELGVVEIRPAFSRKTEESLGYRYVQE